MSIMKTREYPCIIKGHKDGDTIVVDIDKGFSDWKHDVPLRLRKIDTAETDDPDPRIRAVGEAAKAFVQKMLVIGQEYMIQTHKIRNKEEQEKFGRYVADFWVTRNGATTNQSLWPLTTIMTFEGYAVSYPKPINREALREFHIQNYDKLVLARVIEPVPDA
jgi:endonuclease YncB( thermonuclease family)